MTLDIELLGAALPDLTADEIVGLLRAWEARGPSEPADFVSWLHARGAVAEETLARFARAAGAPVQVSDNGWIVPDAGLRVLGQVGRGAMGEVLLARDERLGRTVALKRLDPRLLDDPSLLHRFVVEAQLTAQLDHPGIVPVHTIHTILGEPPSYAMKLVRGQTLTEVMTEARGHVERGEPLPPSLRLAARLELFCQLCEPVAYAHARGVLHRDLKPDNIMVGAYGAVFVMDWGVARVRMGEGSSSGTTAEASGGTLLGEIVGTPKYMSPEQARGENATLSAASDQFGLGVILYELASLRRARATIPGGAMGMLLAAARGHLDPFSPLAEPVGRELRAVIRRATALRPEQRYADVAALAEDVRRVLRGEAVEAAPDALLQRVARGLARHRERVVVALVGAGLLGVAGIALAVAGALTVREVDRERALSREARRLTLGELVSERARGLDRALLGHEGRLRGLAAASERALVDSVDARVYLAGDFADPTRAPSDLVHSKVYGGMASFAHVDIALAPGYDLAAGASRLSSLSSLRPELAAALIGSADPVPADDQTARTLVLQQGAPVVWTYVATDDGALVGFPGTGAYPANYDPRLRPWYLSGVVHDAPAWSRPYEDESGMGLLISCGMAIRVDGRPAAGVAGLDVTVRGLVDRWLTPGELDAEGFLVADDGGVVVRSRGENSPQQGVTPFPWPEVLAAVRGVQGGQASVGEHFAAWSRLHAVDWTYIVVGEASIAD